MKNSAYKIAIITAFLFACLTPAKSFAGDKQKLDHSKSGIIGRIVELPGSWHIRIVTENGEFVEDIQADESGSFKVGLEPGTYRLTPFFPAVIGLGQLVGATTTVTVEKKQFTTVVLPIVQGPE